MALFLDTAGILEDEYYDYEIQIDIEAQFGETIRNTMDYTEEM